MPVVVLRRSRPRDTETAAPSAAGPEAGPHAARPARVFRVVTSGEPEGPSTTSAPSLLPPGARSAEAPPHPLHTPRKRQPRRQQHAPGVATVITFATPAAAAPALPYREQVARLQQLMAALDEALAVAQQASSFELAP
ncbi:hypothetical protein IP87_14015 [beta proteobacterium AAP121]|nr:hypothetical protein IP87_14015 [beta proteobacterium AAP121]